MLGKSSVDLEVLTGRRRRERESGRSKGASGWKRTARPSA